MDALELKRAKKRQKKKQNRFFRRLAQFLSTCLDEEIKTKEDIFQKANQDIVDVGNNLFSWEKFKKQTKSFNEESWKKLIDRTNNYIKENLEIVEEEKKVEEKFWNLIDNDDVLKEHNISLTEIACYDDNYYVAKVYLITGAYMLEGSIEDIVEIIKEELKDKNVNLRTFCPSCTGKNVKFSDYVALCFNCGTMFYPDTSEVIKQYPKEEKQFWNAKFIADSSTIQEN